MFTPVHAGRWAVDPAGRRSGGVQRDGAPDPGAAGAGRVGPTGATPPPAARTCTNDAGNDATSPSSVKKPRAASWLLARISRGEFAGASIRFVSQAMS